MFIPHLDEYIDNPSPQNTQQLYSSLADTRFNIHDLEISSRVFTHWRKNELIPQMEENTWVRLNVFQLLWVFVIEDLRKMGIPLARIKQIRDQLFEPLEFNIEDMFDNGKLKEEYRASGPMFGGEDPETMAEELEKTWKENPQVLETFTQYYKPPIFNMLMANVLYRNMDYTLFITPKEEIHISVDKVSKKSIGEGPTYDELHAKFRGEPLLIIPLRKYLYKLTTTARYEDRITDMQVLNEAEQEVIRMMRDGNLKELRIIFNPKKNHTDLVYTHSAVGDQAALQEIIDRFKDRKHVQFAMKSTDGKTVIYEYQNRKRFSNEK